MPSQATEFESLLEAVHNALVGVDRAGQIRFANDVTRQVQSRKAHSEQQASELERLAEPERFQRFQRLTVGRELKMIEFTKQIEYLTKHGPAGGGER